MFKAIDTCTHIDGLIATLDSKDKTKFNSLISKELDNIKKQAGQFDTDQGKGFSSNEKKRITEFQAATKQIASVDEDYQKILALQEKHTKAASKSPEYDDITNMLIKVGNALGELLRNMRTQLTDTLAQAIKF